MGIWIFWTKRGETVKHIFDKVGKYKVSLRVTSTTDEYNVAEKEIIVEETVKSGGRYHSC